MMANCCKLRKDCENVKEVGQKGGIGVARSVRQTREEKVTSRQQFQLYVIRVTVNICSCNLTEIC